MNKKKPAISFKMLFAFINIPNYSRWNLNNGNHFDGDDDDKTIGMVVKHSSCMCVLIKMTHF